MAEITLTAENFEQEIMSSPVPVLIDFWAPWCGPCRMVAPIVAELAEEYEGRVKVCKVNVDEQRALASSFRVLSIPTLVLMKNGKIRETAVGYRPKEQLVAMLGL